MSQVSDVSLANQGFGAFRAELNNILAALNSNHLGNSTPGSITQGTIWIDNTNIGSNSLTMKVYDGSDNITMATIDTSNNTINFVDSATSVAGISTSATGTVLTLTNSALTLNPAGPVSLGGASTQAGELRFLEDTDDGSEFIALKGAAVSSSVTFTLPTADGSNGQVLTTNGSGQLSFSTASSGATAGFAVAMAIAL